MAHGGSNFDFHIILANLDKDIIDFKDVKVLAKSSEKIIEISMLKNVETLHPLKYSYEEEEGEKRAKSDSCRVKLRFLDHCNFQLSSLSALSAALSKDGCKYWHMLTASLPQMLPHLKTYDASFTELLLKKLPYCYKYLSSPEVLKDGHPLPPREMWDNDLKNEKMTDEE